MTAHYSELGELKDNERIDTEYKENVRVVEVTRPDDPSFRLIDVVQQDLSGCLPNVCYMRHS